MNAEQLAQFIHETYERLAPEFGYKTRKETAIPWEDIPENSPNKRLMIAVSEEVFKCLVPAGAMVLTPARGKNIHVGEWCPTCNRPKNLSFTFVSGDDPEAVELPEQCRCTWLTAGTTGLGFIGVNHVGI